MGALELKMGFLTALAALGIFAPLPDVLGGMMVGLAASYAAFIVSPPADRMNLWGTLFVGFVVALLAAIAHPHIPLAEDLPLQLVMGLAGCLSKYIVQGALNYGRARAKGAANLPGFPGEEK